MAFAAGYVRATSGDGSMLNNAILRRTYSYAHQQVNTRMSSAVDFFALAGKADAEIVTGVYEQNLFDANGDDVIENCFSLFDGGVSPDGNGLAVSSALGASSLPVPNTRQRRGRATRRAAA